MLATRLVPAVQDVAIEHLRALAAQERGVIITSIGIAAGCALLVTALASWRPAAGDETGSNIAWLLREILPVTIAVPLLILAVMWPLSVWRRDPPSRRGWLWTMPLSRGWHTMLRVGIGWVFMIASIALYLGLVTVVLVPLAGRTLDLTRAYVLHGLLSATIAYLLASTLTIRFERAGTIFFFGVGGLFLLAAQVPDALIGELTSVFSGLIPGLPVAAIVWSTSAAAWLAVALGGCLAAAFVHPASGRAG